ncbi:amidase [Azospirillum doebereinerae]
MSLFPDYEHYDAIGLAGLVRDKAISPLELVEEAIRRIELVNPAINAVVHTFYEEARRVAASPTLSGPLAGVPFLLKDLNILYKGQRTSNGGRLWLDNVAPHDSTITERYRAAGLVVLGTTNTAELGLACETAPRAFGPTRNPWDLSRSAGGSSGGAAAAVAAGLVPAVHGTDGGGSIRIPSSNCGVFGVKPTRARNPFGPDNGEGWNGLSVHHAITRSVRDSAALLDATHGPAPGDPYAAPAFVGRFLDAVTQEPPRLRVAFQTTAHDGAAIHPDCVEAVTAAATLLADLGHEVEEARPAIDADAMKRATRVIVASNIANVLRLRGEALGRRVIAEDVEPITWLWAQEARTHTGEDLARAVWTIHRLARVLGGFFQRYDVLLTSTFAAPPLPLNTVDTGGTDLDAYYEGLRRYSAFTSLYNCTGVPAASVPLHWNADNLPIGVQIATRLGEDALLYSLAGQLERARPWRDRRPAIR